MRKKMPVTVVGPGSLGGALAIALSGAGYPVKEIVYRSDPKRAHAIARKIVAKAVRFEHASFVGQVIWICVADAAIAETARAMATRGEWRGKIVFHASGALASDELRLLKSRGAKVASAHPMMSFVRSSGGEFKGVVFALEGDPEAKRVATEMAKAMDATSFDLKKKDKALYHALGAFSSPLLIAHLAAAEKIGRKLGLKPERTRQVIGPILQKTLSNYLQHGPADAFSGPMKRGDVETIGRNLQALEQVPGAAEIFRVLTEMAVRELPVANKAATLKLLGRK